MQTISAETEAFYREQIDSIDPRIVQIEVAETITLSLRLWVVVVCGLLSWIPVLLLVRIVHRLLST